MKNICPDCGTENEKEYVYCKNCGVKLGAAPLEEAPAEAPARRYEQPQYAPQDFSSPPVNPSYDSIGGIPVGEVEAFVANPNITAKFVRLEKTGGKVSWCWPVAILGFLLGPAGAAIWFFRRKMYKIALVLLAIGVAVTAVSSAASVYVYNAVDGAGFESSIEAFFNGFITSEEMGEIVTQFLHNAVSPAVLAVVLTVSLLENAAVIGSAVLCGLFAMHWYKGYVVSRISRYRAVSIDPRYYQLGLASIGGTSGGMTALGIICVVLLNIVSENITSLFM